MDSNITKFLALFFLLIIECYALGTSDRVIESKGNIHLVPSVKTYSAKPFHVEEQNAIRVEDFTGGQYIGIKAPLTVATSIDFTLPGVDGLSGQCLKTDGSLVLSFGDCSEYIATNDNRLLRSNTGGGADIQESGITVNDLDEITGVAAITSASATINGNFAVVSTSTPSIPAPVATQAQIDLMPTGEGRQAYNSTTKKLNIHDGTDWVEVGAGGGSSFENIFTDGGFDNDATSGVDGLTCGTGNSCAQITTASNFINGTGALEVTMGGSNPVNIIKCYDNSSSEAWDGKEAMVQAQINSLITDLQFCSYDGTNEDACTAVGAIKGNGVYQLVQASMIPANGEDICFKIKSTANPTAGTKVYVDAGFAGEPNYYKNINRENVFSAKVSSTGVVSAEGIDWINGNASIATTSLYTITFTNNFFTQPPNCVATTGVYNTYAQISSTSSSAVDIRIRDAITGTSNVAADFDIICQRSSTDYGVTTENVVTPLDNVFPVSYQSTVAQSIDNATDEIIDYATKTTGFTDPDGYVTTGAAWKYTAKVSGYYEVNASVELDDSADNTSKYFAVWKNGSIEKIIDKKSPKDIDTDSNSLSFTGTYTLYLAKDDYVDVRLFQNTGGAIALSANANTNWIQIKRIDKSALAAFPTQEVQCDLTVTGTSSFSQVFGTVIPYQTRNGEWRAKLNFGGTNSNTSSITFTLTGLTFKSGADQAISGVGGGPIAAGCVINGGASTIGCASGGATAYRVNGDVMLNSKPTISGCDF